MKKDKLVIICTRILGGYKLTICINEKLPPTKKLFEKTFRGKLLATIFNNTDRWISKCRDKGILITEIELILPPLLEYADLERDLRPFFMKNNITFSIAIGLQISAEKNNEQYFWDEGLIMLNKRNTDFN